MQQAQIQNGYIGCHSRLNESIIWILPLPKMGFVPGNRVKELIRVFTYSKRLEELDIPVAIVATDIQTGEKVVFQEGPIAPAVRASISIPGIFVPEKINNRLLVDGGVVDRVPVSVQKKWVLI